MGHGLKNMTEAQRYLGTIADPEEKQWLELVLFQLLLYETKKAQPYPYDCDALYVLHAMQLLWQRRTVLKKTVEGTRGMATIQEKSAN